MSETLISPGVLANENDQSFITQQPISVGAAIIGPTVKGQKEVPIVVTSYSEYQNKFGTTFVSASNVYTYFTSIAAYHYFMNGGTSLLVAPVGSGSFTPATTLSGSGTWIRNATGSEVFTLETLSEGTLMNNSGSVDSNGALSSGSIDNVRWAIQNSDSSSGTFTLLVRRGDDTTNNQIVLETWTNLSLDPFSQNFISKVIGDQTLNYNATTNQIETSGSYPNSSKYVRVSNVSLLTPNYFDNSGSPKAQYTSSLPTNSSGSFGGAVGGIMNGAQYYDAITDGNKSQGIPSGSYTNMINLLSNQNDYRFNVLLTPGLFDSLQTSLCTSIITNTQERGDNIFVLDLVPYNVVSVNSVVTQANTRNTSYAAAYWPWIQVKDPDSGRNVWVPASTVMGGVYAYTDSTGAPWFAPAGMQQGALRSVIMPAQKLSQSSKDSLYSNKVNSIGNFPGIGLAVLGQKTLQTQASALDRVNVRRLLIELKSYISQLANNLLFQQNTLATRNQFLSQVNPYLESVQQRQGLYGFKVVMDDSNNTNDVIDRNQLVGDIYIQPTKTAEFIYLNFNITPTGTTFN